MVDPGDVDRLEAHIRTQKRPQKRDPIPLQIADNPGLRGNQAGPIQRGRPCFITPPAARSAGRASQRKPDSSGYLPPAEG